MSLEPEAWPIADSIAATAELLGEVDDRARLVSPHDGTWVIVESGRSHWTAAGSYAATLREERILTLMLDGRGAIALAEVDGEAIAFQEFATGGGSVVRRIGLDDVPLPVEPHDRVSRRLANVVSELSLDAFAASTYPLQLSDLADALDYQELDEAIMGRVLVSAARRRSSFPFHEFEALTSAGPLARADSLEAIATMRNELETCDVILAERWAHTVLIDMAQETALEPDPSPTGGMAFSPDAHMLADWLHVSVAELAAGEGNLVILGHKFAEDPELVEVGDGEVSSAHPIATDPWHLWVLDVGRIVRFRLRSR